MKNNREYIVCGESGNGVSKNVVFGNKSDIIVINFPSVPHKQSYRKELIMPTVEKKQPNVKIASRKSAMSDLTEVSTLNVSTGTLENKMGVETENYFTAIRADVAVESFLNNYTKHIYTAVSTVVAFRNFDKKQRIDFTVSTADYTELVKLVIDTIDGKVQSVGGAEAIKTSIGNAKKIFTQYNFIIKLVNSVLNGEEAPATPKHFDLFDIEKFTVVLKAKEEGTIRTALDNQNRILQKFTDNGNSINADLIEIGTRYKAEAVTDREEWIKKNAINA
jgi:hypothetical protein